MRPLFSVMHSPRLTKRNGVETRMAPPRMASGTPQRPMPVSSISARLFARSSGWKMRKRP